MNKGRLFTASCIALIATAMSFAIRGDIMGDFETIFHLNKTNLGWIAGAAFWGFGLSIFIGGPLCDRLGMGTIMRLAAAGHIGGTLLTLVAPNFEVLFLATVIIGIANGLVEAAVNPLIATIYPTTRPRSSPPSTPGSPAASSSAACWRSCSRRSASDGRRRCCCCSCRRSSTPSCSSARNSRHRARSRGRAVQRHVQGAPRPLFLVIWFSMCLTAVTELGPGQWYANVFNEVMGSTARAGMLVLVWVNGIMYLMRQFAGGISHRVSPMLLIATTAISAALGLYLFSHADLDADARSLRRRFLAIGTAFWWPTMLGITSERFPKAGALGLAIVGGTGSIATAIAGPVMGALNDRFGPRDMLAIWAIIPVVLIVIFGAIYMRDKASGRVSRREDWRVGECAAVLPVLRIHLWGRASALQKAGGRGIDAMRQAFGALVLAIVVAGLARVGADAAFPDQVKVEGGAVKGAVADGVLSFKGIPFAAPPVGDLRWRPPQPVVPWTRSERGHGVRPRLRAEAGRDRRRAARDRTERGLPGPERLASLGEDERRPAGHGLDLRRRLRQRRLSPAVYDGSQFAKQGVVLVSFNYRIGRFGFFAHPALSAEQPGRAARQLRADGSDRRAAVGAERNIAGFGGDPKNVTVFGESAGGMSVHTLLTSPAAKGLFHKAIIESGGGRSGLLTMRKAARRPAERSAVCRSGRRGLREEQRDRGRRRGGVEGAARACRPTRSSPG